MNTETFPLPLPLLQIKSVAKRYDSHQALKTVSIDMRKGEIISVLGPSGCGKSTLLQLIAGLSLPDEGEILLDGKIIASSKGMLPPERRSVNMVFQDYALWPHMSVFDNIAYGLTIRKMDRTAIRERVTELLDLLQLNGLEKRLPPQMSGGQQQRVAIARALATQPALLLLDEPLSNLDIRLRIEMRTMAYIFRKLGTSVFHVTHDPEEAFAMADRLLIMRDGEVDQVGTPQQCYSHPASRWAASLLGAINRMEGTIVHTNVGTGIQCGSTVIYGVTDSPSKPEGSSAELLFRPEDLVIMNDPSSMQSQADSSELQTRLQVKILYSTFEGKRWRSIVHSEAGHKLYLLGDSPLEQGASMTVALPKTSAFIYPKT